MKSAFSIRPKGEAIRSEQGFSLVELMVAMVIGLIVVLVVGALFMNSRQTYLTQDANSRLQENARYATELFGRQLRTAGYVSINFSPPSGGLFERTREIKFSGKPVLGTGNSITLSFDGNKDCLGQAATRPINIFRVNASSQLECQVGGNVGVILDDVESMQVTYRQPGDTAYKAASAVNMANVTSVRICLLLRAKADGNQRGIEAGRGQTYDDDCSAATDPVTKSDGYIRRAIGMTVVLRNQMP